MTSQDYIDAALQTVQAGIKDTRWKIPVKVQTPIAAGYIPELDDTPELDANQVTRFREYIGILRWATA